MTGSKNRSQRVHPQVRMANVHVCRAALGAFLGMVVSVAMTAIAGAIWGGIDRAAPCKVSGEPPVWYGALFGMMCFVLMFTPYAVVIGASIGACVTAFHPRLIATINPKIIAFLAPRRKQADRIGQN